MHGGPFEMLAEVMLVSRGDRLKPLKVACPLVCKYFWCVLAACAAMLACHA